MADEVEQSTFKADYAASDRSKCNRCRQPIPKGELRIGPMVQSDKGDFKYPQWHHFPCFEDGYLKRNPGSLTSVASVSGIDSLKFEDQKRIKSLVVGGDSTLETKAVTAEEKQVAADNKMMWNRKEKLEDLDNSELTALLEHNNQPCKGKIFGGRGKMIERAADGMVFGALPKCPACPDGDMYFSHGVYKCTGAIDEYARCENKLTDVERLPFKVPSYLGDSHDFLRKYKYVKRSRQAVALEGSNPVAQDAAEAPAGEASVGEKRKRQAAAPSTADLAPFAGYAVMFAGKLSKTQSALSDVIIKHGGTVASSASSATVCVCTTQEATGNGSQKGKDALKKGVLCVDEKWIDQSVETGHRLDNDELAGFVLANPKVVVADEEREKRKRIGDKMEVEAKAKEEREALEEKYTDKPTKSTGKKLLTIKGSSAVDPSSGLAEMGQIYAAQGSEFNVTMNNADVTTGKNSFYILQIVEHEGKKKWSLFRKWGRLGEDDIGGQKVSDYPIPEPAVREFKKVFRDKTGNDFGTKSFKKVYGKFSPVEVDYSAAATGGPAVEPTTYKGALPKPTQELMSLIFDIKAMTETLKQLEIDTSKMPLGNLSKKTIATGFEVLTTLQKTIAAGGENRSKIVSLTNRFFNTVPHVPPEGGTLPLLDTEEKIKEKVTLVTALQDLEVASKMVAVEEPAEGEGEVHTIDAHYKKLKTDLNVVSKDSEEFRRIEKYLQNTHAKTHNMYTLELVDLWTIEREGEADRYRSWENNSNRQLLWHGSRITNWSGILSQGLRIAPPEAPSTGYMFGKGVYFADMSSKSANYCFTSSEKTTGVMMLGEVALGDMFPLKHAFFVDGLKAPFKSTKGLGKNEPNPKQDFTEENGCKIPMGEGHASGIADTTLLYNEYIVYDVSQIKMRYLLRLNFHYKKKTGTFF